MVYGAPPSTILKVHQTYDGTDTMFLQTPTSFKIPERGGKKRKAQVNQYLKQRRTKTVGL